MQHLERVLEIRPAIVAHDLHPDYLSTSFAAAIPGLTKVAVQHHHAHMASCMAEHRLEVAVIGVILDGAGYGGVAPLLRVSHRFLFLELHRPGSLLRRTWEGVQARLG